MSEFVTFEVAAEEIEDPASSSSEEIASSGSEEEIESSNSSEEIESGDSEESAIRTIADAATEAEASYYRVFDMQGRPLYTGNTKPNKMVATRAIVVEYSKSGTAIRRYIQTK